MHDEKYKVEIADPNHPITRGLSDFEIEDVTYSHFYVKKDVHVLLTTDHPTSGPIIGWVNKYGNSEVVYLVHGHDEKAYYNSNYQKLVLNAIEWASASQKKP